MAEKDSTGGFFGFMDSEFTRCPCCNEMISRSQLQSAFDKETKSITCPYCKTQIGIYELMGGLD